MFPVQELLFVYSNTRVLSTEKLLKCWFIAWLSGRFGASWFWPWAFVDGSTYFRESSQVWLFYTCPRGHNIIANRNRSVWSFCDCVKSERKPFLHMKYYIWKGSKARFDFFEKKIWVLRASDHCISVQISAISLRVGPIVKYTFKVKWL